MIVDAFLTGSRAYGVPRADSDYDIVIRCDRKDAVEFGADLNGDTSGYPLDEHAWQVKKGAVNFILCFTDARFQSWKDGTDKLCTIKPASRDVAKAVFIDLFKREKACQP